MLTKNRALTDTANRNYKALEKKKKELLSMLVVVVLL